MGLLVPQLKAIWLKWTLEVRAAAVDRSGGRVSLGLWTLMGTANRLATCLMVASLVRTVANPLVNRCSGLNKCRVNRTKEVSILKARVLCTISSFFSYSILLTVIRETYLRAEDIVELQKTAPLIVATQCRPAV